MTTVSRHKRGANVLDFSSESERGFWTSTKLGRGRRQGFWDADIDGELLGISSKMGSPSDPGACRTLPVRERHDTTGFKRHSLEVWAA